MASNRAASLQIVDQVLTNLARSYRSHGFIYDQLVADISVQTLTGKYPIFTDEYWFRNEVDTLTSDRSPSKEIDFQWSTDSWSCEEHALKVSITDLERQQAHPGLRLERSKVEFLMHRFQIAREIRLATILQDSDVTGGQLSASRDSTPSVNWDQATATIEADIKTAVLDVYDTIGYAPNVIVIPYKVAYAMAVQEDIREILKYTVNGQQIINLGSRVLPATIHGMRVIIPMGAQKDTGNEGAAASRSEIWGADVRCLYVEAGAQWGTPSVVYRFSHTAPTVTRFRTDDPDVEYIRVKERLDEKVVAPDAGHIIKAVL